MRTSSGEWKRIFLTLTIKLLDHPLTFDFAPEFFQFCDKLFGTVAANPLWMNSSKNTETF